MWQKSKHELYKQLDLVYDALRASEAEQVTYGRWVFRAGTRGFMRNAYTIELDELNDDLYTLAATARETMIDAAHSFLERDVHRAEASIGQSALLAELGTKCADRAVPLLAPPSTRRNRSATGLFDRAHWYRPSPHGRVGRTHRRSRPPTLPGRDPSGLPGAEVRAPGQRMRGEGRPSAPGTRRHRHRDHCRTGRPGRSGRPTVDEVIASIIDESRGNDVKKAVDIALLCRFYQRYAAQAVDVGQRVGSWSVLRARNSPCPPAENPCCGQRRSRSRLLAAWYWFTWSAITCDGDLMWSAFARG